MNHLPYHLEGRMTMRMTMLAAACRHTLRSSAVRAASRQQPGSVVRRFESTKSEQAKPEITFEAAEPKVDSTKPPTMQNMALAVALVGFVGGVFTYSMNAVGKSQEGIDPLSQLKAEAQDAREHNQHNRKLTPEEVQALESGPTGEYDNSTQLEVAVAAPAGIAQLEEEAHLKVFRQTQGDVQEKKKKAWWRFGL